MIFVYLTSLLYFLTNLNLSSGHVALTFPPARYLPSDYLVRGRGKGPCGYLPESDAPRTTFIQGSTIEVTWFLSYVHQGGVQIELIRENKQNPYNMQVLARLTGQTSLFKNDTTLQSITVSLPRDLTCDDCALRLKRQGAEYSQTYFFYSCADVTILPMTSLQPTSRGGRDVGCFPGKCLNEGECDETTGECSCRRLFSGLRCQNEDQCWNDGDCSNNGECIDTRNANYPRQVCYCRVGWFGSQCHKESMLTEIRSDYDEDSSYGRMNLYGRGDEARVFWKFFADEIEIVVRAPTSSWLGVGWRPSGRGTCHDLEDASKVDKKMKFRRDDIYDIIAPYLNGTDRTVHQDPEAQIEYNIGSNNERRCGVTPPPPPSGMGTQRVTTTTPPPITTTASRRRKYPYTLEQWFDILDWADGQGGLVQQQVYEIFYDDWPEYRERKRRSAKSEENLSRQKRGASRDGQWYHPMGCVDIIVGSVKDDLYRVNDMFSWEGSAPHDDYIYGGTDDITAAMGTQVNGITTIAFRKKVTATHFSDHTVERERMHFIWAKGQEINANIHYGCRTSDHRFYKHDQLKYHGYGRYQHGRLNIDFSLPSPTRPPTTRPSRTRRPRPTQSCVESASYSSPQGCVDNCEYSVTIIDSGSNSVLILVEARIERNDYAAVGISNDRFMPSTDIYTITINGANEIIIIDRWAEGYFLPNADETNNVSNIAGSYEDGYLRVQFNRPRDTGNSEDDLSLNECRHVFYATGPITGGNGIAKHTAKYVITNQQKLCLC